MTLNILLKMMSTFIVLLCTGVSILLLSPTISEAQDIRDSKGKEFWITFLPNYHNTPLIQEDSLYIFITAEQPASGKIEYFDKFGTPYTTTFSIGKDEFFIFSKVFKNFELNGYNSPGGGPNSAKEASQESDIALQSFKVTSSSDVTVYGLNQAETTSDAFISLPSDVLGQQYMIISYSTDISMNSPQSTPSQFAVLATRNNTKITIIPSVPTVQNPTKTPENITLNTGEIYLLQAPNDQMDLTGTKITSSEPIAVFAGHQRAKVPNPSSLSSRDHLVEQLPPIPTWGGSAFVTPYPLAENADPNEFDIYRVMAANDNTKIYIDGVFNRTLNSGQYYDTELKIAQWITATGPILVAQYKKSSNNPGSSSLTGDPFMIINSPTEQYLKRFHCFNVKAWQLNNLNQPVPVYDNEQYLTIIVPTDSVGTVRLDGKLVDPARFKKLSITSYSYTDSMRVTTGVHTVESNAKMGVYVYGYGAANSYGYIGGMGYDTIYTFNPPDIIPPLILGNSTCGVFKGGVFDTLSFDKGIKSVETIPTEVINANVLIGAITDSARSVVISATLKDPFEDGKIGITARDSSDGHREQSFDIPGFTIRSTLSTSTTIPQYEESTILSLKKCVTVELVNYGKFQHTITEFSFLKNTPHFTVSTPLPFMLFPGQRKTVEICIDAKESGEFSDTLIIATPCIKRNVAVVTMKVKSPLNVVSDTDCFDFKSSLYDTSSVRIGVQSVESIPGSLINTVVTIDPQSNIPGWDSLTYTARLVDPFFDGSGKLLVQSDDVQTSVDFEIPGFTLHPDPVDFFLKNVAEDVRAQRQICFPVIVKNYGKFPQTITSAAFKNNSSLVSVTPQFITINPGSEDTVRVCFLFENSDVFSDTLFIGNDCISRPIAHFLLKAVRDSIRPEITRISDSCELQDKIVFKDELKFDWGIQSYAVLENVNATIAIDTSALPFSIAFTAQNIDRKNDARYRIQVADSAGNVRDTTVIIQGFTLSVLSAGNGVYQFDSVVNYSPFCETISIYNSSELPFVLDEAVLKDNIYFSAPLSQFPLVIPPKDTGHLVVCFEAEQHRDYADSISLKKYCIEEIIGLEGSKKDEIFSGNSQCDVSVQVSSKTIPGKPFIQKSFPNPADEFTTLRFGVTQSGRVKIVLFDDRGNEAAVFTNADYAPGMYELQVKTGDFKNGQYYYKFTAGDVVEINTFTIVH
jgi:hypothetical protein